jgi:uncharacterized protein (DUF58 family)
VSPTPRALALAAAWLGLGLVASAVPAALGPWAGLGGALALLLMVDALMLRGRPTPAVTRQLGAALAQGEPEPLRLRVENPGRSALQVELLQPATPGVEAQGLEGALRVGPGGYAELDGELRPLRRGEHRLGAVWLRLAGPLGLMRAAREAAPEAVIRVYPNYRQVTRYAALAMQQNTAALGVHPQRRRGEGTEFHQLREYREGDGLRQIDWKAVSRRRQLISREYREEQDQHVVFLLDCGRRMRAQDGERSHFDAVLNAALLLSWVALRQGDSVGFLTFSGHDRWLPPRKGRGTLPALLDQLFDLDATEVPADYAEAAARLAARQRRRALVVLLTNLRDDDAAELGPALAPLRRRHLVLVASLREAALTEALARPADDFEGALRAGAAAHLLAERRRAHALLQGRGAQALDVLPAELPLALVNRYLEIKRAGLL